MSALCLYGFFFGTPLCKFAPPCRGVQKKFGSLRSPVRTPLNKTLKPPLHKPKKDVSRLCFSYTYIFWYIIKQMVHNATSFSFQIINMFNSSLKKVSALMPTLWKCKIFIKLVMTSEIFNLFVQNLILSKLHINDNKF
jgi:hypothetical protein